MTCGVRHSQHYPLFIATIFMGPISSLSFISSPHKQAAALNGLKTGKHISGMCPLLPQLSHSGVHKWLEFTLKRLVEDGSSPHSHDDHFYGHFCYSLGATYTCSI